MYSNIQFHMTTLLSDVLVAIGKLQCSIRYAAVKYATVKQILIMFFYKIKTNTHNVFC